MGIADSSAATNSSAGTDCPTEDQVDATWLAGMLGHPGGLRSVDRRPIGTGQVGENVRYTLHWDESVAANNPALPATVVGKFPAHDEISLETAKLTETYVREIGFYRDLQDTVSIRTPELYFLGEALDENRFALIMEDIAPAEQGDQIAGTTVERAAQAVAALPGLHGPHWGRDFQGWLDWCPVPNEDALAGRHGLYQLVFEGFVERYESRLDGAVIDFGRWVLEHAPAVFGALRSPMTLVHGDYRLDNMLFATGPGAPPLTVVDWQTANIGYGAVDLAYFIGAGLEFDERRGAEADLVELYIDTMRSAGVLGSDEAIADVGHDYVAGTIAGFYMAVIASQIVGQTDRGDEMFCVMAERHAAQAQDNGIFDLIR